MLLLGLAGNHRPSEEDPKAKTLEAFATNNKESTSADA